MLQPENFIRKIEPPTVSPDILARLKKTWINALYQKYFKQIPLMQRIAILIWRAIISKFLNYLVFYFSSQDSKRWRPLIKLKNYIKEEGISTIKILEAEVFSISKAKVFPVDDQALFSSQHDSYTFPPVYIATVNNSIVYGGTNFVFTDKVVICHDLYDFERDFTSEELHGRHQICPHKMHMRLLCHDKFPDSISVAATFVDACAQNYAHWLTEVLPRIALFCNLDQFKDIPILINDGLHENILESLLLITGSDREIISIPVGRALKVNSLLITSVVGYVPFGPRNIKLSNTSHGRFSPSALEFIRKKYSVLTEKKNDHDWPELIYLRRNSDVRKITNAAEIEKLFSSHGYALVEPENLTFLQQVQLFSNANKIVSATGAALANGIFCKPGRCIGVLMAKHEEMIYRYWINMLAPIQIEIVSFLGNIDSNRHLGIHADFIVSSKDVLNFISVRERE